MFNSNLFDFKSGKKKLGKVLGDLEAEIMDAVWLKETCTVRDIYEELRLKRKIAYTTVMTIMTRLAEKGLLLKEKHGPAFLYRPSLSKEEFGKTVTSEIISELVDGFGKGVFAQLIEEAGKAAPETLDELERIIAERKKQKNR